MIESSVKIGETVLLVRLPLERCIRCPLCRGNLSDIVGAWVGDNEFGRGVAEVECSNGMIKIRGAVNGKPFNLTKTDRE